MVRQHVIVTATLSHPMCWGSRGWIRKVRSSTVTALAAARVMILKPNVQIAISGQQEISLQTGRDGLMGPRRTINWHHQRQYATSVIHLIEAMVMARQHVMIVMAVLAEAEVVADMFWGISG